VNWLRRRIGTNALPSLEAYALWAETYPAYSHNVLMELEEAAMRRIMPDIRGARVLDLAGGTGRWSRIALEGEAERVICLDNSVPMLRAGSTRLRTAGAMEALPLKAAAVDGIICGLAIGHCRALPPVFREMARVLRSGGWALISDFHPAAYAKGARRTFTDARGHSYSVEHHVHSLESVSRNAQDSDMDVVQREEAALNGAGPDAMQGQPVVVVYLFRRP
jgi:malonyl-CoA O-methyltransferase